MNLKLLFIFPLFLILNRAVSQNPVYEWANAIGTNTASGASGVVIKTNASGEIYLTGYFSGALDLDPSAGITNITSYAGSQDFFVAKYGNLGTLLWAKVIGGSQADECNSMAIDNAGNVLITGLFKGIVDLDPGVGVSNFGTSTNTGDVFFEKLDANGNLVWVNTLSNNHQKNAYAITTDQNNNVVITGYFYGTIDFDPGPAVANYSNLSYNVYYIAKYDANGNYIWTNIAQQSTWDNFGRSLVCDNNNNIFLGGDFTGQVDLDPSSNVNLLTSGGGSDVFFAKFDAAGNLIFAENASGGGNDALSCITLDANKNVFITGDLYGGAVDFDPSAAIVTPYTSSSSNTIFIAKYDSLGNYIWVNTIGSSGGTNSGKSVVTDAMGNVYATGGFGGTADFDPSASLANLVCVGNNDIYMAKYNSTGNYLWAKKIGSTGFDIGQSVALTPSGNLIITGFFNNVADFDPSSSVYNLSASVLNPMANQNLFIADYTQSTCAFSNAFAPLDALGNDEHPGCLKKDPSGNIYVCGGFSGTVDFDLSPTSSYYMLSKGDLDGFIAKYSPTGAFIWARRIGGPKMDECKSIAIDNLGNCLVTGTFDSTSTFNAALTATLATNGSQDAFIMKLNPVGFLLWYAGFGGNGNESGTAITVDNANYVCVGGTFEGTMDSDPSAGTNTIFSNGYSDIFFSKFTNFGNFVWGNSIGSTVIETVNSMATDNSGNILMTGGFGGPTDFDPSPSTVANLNASGYDDIFVAKYDPYGNYMHAFKIGNTGPEDGESICVDAQNNYIICGKFNGVVDFNPATFSTYTLSSNAVDAFVAKYDSLGNFKWVDQIGGATTQYGAEVVTDLNSDIYITGTFFSPVNFGPITLNNTGFSDQFIAKYDSLGLLKWATNAGGSSYNFGVSLDVDNNFNIYATGTFSGVTDFDPSSAVANLPGAGGNDAFLLKYKQCFNATANVSSQGNVNCFGGNDGFINLTNTPGSGFTYSWSPVSSSSYSIANLSQGNYSCSVTNSCGATATINVIISQPPSLNLNVSQTTFTACYNNSYNYYSTASGGTAPYTYTWSTGANTASMVVTPTSSVIYTLNITDAHNCFQAATSSPITIIPGPTVNVISSSSIVCSGSPVSLSASGANSYTWSNSVTGASIVVSPTNTLPYTVTGINSNNCTATQSISFNIIPLPNISVIATPTFVCLGGSVTINASGTPSYTWNTGSNNSSITVAPIANTFYTVTGTSTLGCTKSAVQLITVHQPPNVYASSSATTICAGMDATLTAYGANSYSWSTGATGAVISVTPATSTTYTIYGTSAFGCTNTATYLENVFLCTDVAKENLPQNINILIYPNPNNGEFYISEFENNIGRDVEIYNAVGQLVKKLKIENVIQHVVMNEFTNGFYFVKIMDGDSVLSISKIIKNN